MNPLLIAKLAGYVIGLAALVGFALLILSWYNDSKALDLCNAQLEAQTEVIKQNNEATNEYQGKLAALNARLAKRVQPQRCVPVQSTSISGNATSASRNIKQERGLSSQYLRQLAGDMKRTALYVEACSKWVKEQKEN